MPVPSSIDDLSQTPASNSPAGSEFLTTADDYLRAHAAFIAELRDGAGFAQATNLIFPQDGAIIQRLNDRLMVGGATESDLLFPNVVKDWLTTYQQAAGVSNGSILNTQAASLVNTNNAAAIGFLSASRNTNFTSAGTACIGLMGVAWTDNPTYAAPAWAGYYEAHREAGSAASSIYGSELDLRSMMETINPHPWQQGDTIGIQLAVGAEMSATGQFDASAGIQFASNPKKWKKGIVFQHDSLTGSSGGVGESCAMAMAITQNIEWFNSSGVRTTFVRGLTTDTANSAGISFTDTGMYFVDSAGTRPQVLLGFVANAANYLQLLPGTAGSWVQIVAAGTDTDVDIQLTTKGAGRVRLGASASNADAPITGYIEVKDTTGTVRKLAYIA